MADIKAKALQILEKMLPTKGVSLAEREAAQAALRENPEKYSEYLKQLDSAYGKPDVRSKLTGHTDSVYHGTDQNINVFKPSKDGRYGKGIYTANFTDLPNAYAGEGVNGNVMPLKINPGNTLLANNPASTAVMENIKNKNPDLYKKMKNNGDFVNNATMERVFRREVGPDASQKLLKDSGYNSISDKFGEAVVFEPKQVRSTNAAFDPRMTDSSHILAGVAAVPLADESVFDKLKSTAKDLYSKYNSMLQNADKAKESWQNERLNTIYKLSGQQPSAAERQKALEDLKFKDEMSEGAGNSMASISDSGKKAASIAEKMAAKFENSKSTAEKLQNLPYKKDWENMGNIVRAADNAPGAGAVKVVEDVAPKTGTVYKSVAEKIAAEKMAADKLKGTKYLK